MCSLGNAGALSPHGLISQLNAASQIEPYLSRWCAIPQTSLFNKTEIYLALVNCCCTINLHIQDQKTILKTFPDVIKLQYIYPTVFGEDVVVSNVNVLQEDFQKGPMQSEDWFPLKNQGYSYFYSNWIYVENPTPQPGSFLITVGDFHFFPLHKSCLSFYYHQLKQFLLSSVLLLTSDTT